MKKYWLFFLFLFFPFQFIYADYWAKTYGGDRDELPSFSFQQTSDGGFIIAGYTESFGAGSDDDLILKLDPNGNIQWQKTYGGTSSDRAYAIKQTSDGGYIVAGSTYSFGAGSTDYWILKLDANGNIQWQKTYGGSNYEEVYSIQQTSDGGYIVAGYTYSFGAGGADYWILKLDANGSIQWQKTYGGPNGEVPISIQQTSDNGFIIAGYTYYYGNSDYLILKLDSDGNIQWQKSYGGSNYDYAFSIQQTSDGGYIVAGYTSSFGAGNEDYLILKLDTNGNVQWQKTYGGSSSDYAYSIQQTSDGGYIVAGYTRSFGAGYSDYWILKLDSDGNIQWQKTYGGDSFDEGRSIQQTSEEGFIILGSTYSFGAGGADYWILKLNQNGDIPNCPYGQTTNATITTPSVIVDNSSTTIEIPQFSSDNTSVTPIDSNATVNEVCYYSQATKNVPSLNEWGIIILTILSGLFGIFYLKRKEI